MSFLTSYETLLFDADETLLDFKAAQYDALTTLFTTFGHELTTDIRERYHEINISLWQAYERGEIPREKVLTSRFQLLFQELGFSIDGKQYEEIYQPALNKGHKIIPHAREILTSLKKTHKLYIVSNGVTETQFTRLRDSGLISFFDDVFVSEAAGYQKPKREFFDYVFSHIKNVNLKETIIIGDSLSSDMRGGVNAGIATCWYNSNHVVNTTDIKPDYEIHNLLELISE